VAVTRYKVALTETEVVEHQGQRTREVRDILAVDVTGEQAATLRALILGSLAAYTGPEGP
jgi:hypothetical protein